MIIDDKHCIVCNNLKQKTYLGKRNVPSLIIPNFSRHPIKWCFWCDWMGIEYYKILPQNQISKYCSQMSKGSNCRKLVKMANQKGVIFLQDDERSHICTKIRIKLVHPGCDVILNPLYSPDFAPSDYQLLRSLLYSLNQKNFNSQ